MGVLLPVSARYSCSVPSRILLMPASGRLPTTAETWGIYGIFSYPDIHLPRPAVGERHFAAAVRVGRLLRRHVLLAAGLKLSYIACRWGQIPFCISLSNPQTQSPVLVLLSLNTIPHNNCITLYRKPVGFPFATGLYYSVEGTSRLVRIACVYSPTRYRTHHETTPTV